MKAELSLDEDFLILGRSRKNRAGIRFKDAGAELQCGTFYVTNFSRYLGWLDPFNRGPLRGITACQWWPFTTDSQHQSETGLDVINTPSA